MNSMDLSDPEVEMCVTAHFRVSEKCWPLTVCSRI